MPRAYSAQAINATQASSEGGDTTVTFASKVNARFAEVLALFDSIIPNTGHSIPAAPTANQVLQAVSTNVLGWVTLLNLIKLGAGTTTYAQNDLVLNAFKLYVVNTAYTSGGSFDPNSANLTLISGLTAAENTANILSHTRFTTGYSDSAPNRTYTVVDGKRYFIDALPGGITTEIFRVPDLSGATTAFEFTIMPRERNLTINPITIQRNVSDSSAQFFTMASPTTIISDDITISTNGVYQFIGRRESSQTKWTVIKLDYN